ncbi:MAG: 50S ribosomal protein L23 [Deinococcota bacterium]|jgi:large subunit ribosomal protein L23|nr:50S ribosomal protein L23 [Deinococcota bacterium]
MTAHEVILGPVLSEKAVTSIADSKYAFYVHPTANRTQIKEAVETVFGVDVTKINVQVKEGKVKSMGRYSGRRPGRKKAIVTLKPGQRIQQLDGLT